MAKKNVPATTITKAESDSRTPQRVVRTIREDTARVDPETLYEEITKNRYHIKNFKFPFADELYPAQPGLRSVDKYFPIAEGGPLYVDIPQHQADLAECKKKAAFFKEKKIRYLYISGDTDMVAAQEQLGLI